MGPYYQPLKGEGYNHPSYDATPEEILGIHTWADIQRVFPDYPLTTTPMKVFRLGKDGKMYLVKTITDPVELEKHDVNLVHGCNPYSCDPWYIIWMRKKIPWQHYR